MTQEFKDVILHRIVNLLVAMRENDPDDGAADAVTCAMVWKKEATDILQALDRDMALEDHLKERDL